MKDIAIPIDNVFDELERSLIYRNVSIVEFAESDKFCNKPLYPRQRVLLKLIFLEELDGYEEDVLNEWIEGKNGVFICPKIRERVSYLRENGYPHFQIVQLVGGRRSGKGYMTAISIVKKIWDLIQLNDPGQYYGIDPDKDIYISIIAKAQEQAKINQYADIVSTVQNCKAIERYINRILENQLTIYTPTDLANIARLKRQGTDVKRDMARIKVKAFPSVAGSIRGTASIAYVFDEMAHFLAGDSQQSDTEVWYAGVPSLAQFKKDAIVFPNSSPYQEIGKFYELWQDSQKLNESTGEPLFYDHLMIQFPSWEMYRDWERDRKFRNAILIYEDVADEEKSNPEKFAVEYCGKFAKVVDAFLDPNQVDRMFDPVYAENTIGRKLETRRAGIAAHMPYSAHADPSSTTANFGIAIAHIEVVEKDGVKEPHVVFDLIDAFYPYEFENHTIDWTVVMEEILLLIKHFCPQEFTFDQFDSTAPIQLLNAELRRRNISGTRVGEVKFTQPQNLKRCEAFKAALYLGRVHAPNPIGQPNEKSLSLCRDELKFLQLKNGRVVKQDTGPVQTKDMADCVMEVVNKLIGDTLVPVNEMMNQPVLMGGQGGYGIGRHPSPFSEFYRNLRTRNIKKPRTRGRDFRSLYYYVLHSGG